jgi:hypothetical protein
LALATLAALYSQVKVTRSFTEHYDFPEVTSEDQLYSFTGAGVSRADFWCRVTFRRKVHLSV